MSTAGWASFLDALESELQALARVPDGKLRRMPEFVAPDLGQLPSEYAERAHQVLELLHETETALRADLRRTANQIQEMRKLDPRAPRPASRLDTHA